MDGVERFDLCSIHPANRGFSGAVSDGRFIYLVPLNNGESHGRVARHDTQIAFDDPAAWEAFDSTQVNPGSRGFVDGVFDGRYLYLVPFFNDKHHGQVTRYDTRMPFAEASSWSVFDTTLVSANSRGFVSGCFDGRYFYLAPYQLDQSTQHGQITRYDTSRDFNELDAWKVFNLAAVHPDSRGFHSAVCAGEHVYFVPYHLGDKHYSGLMMRHDRRLEFDCEAAWECFDLTSIHEGCRGYVGGVCHDGMLYLAPYIDGKDRHGRVIRFNTRAQLTEANAWSVFDCAGVNSGSRGFFGAICDGRHLFLVPHCRGVGAYHGQLTRHELAMDFNDAASWSFCDLARVEPACRGFMGGAVHAGKLYLAPYEIDAGRHSGLAVRIDLDREDIWTVPGTVNPFFPGADRA